jgi:uncharacterized protein (UPF0303 family)
MSTEKYIELVSEQERVLQFPHFNRRDAWELGKELVSIILEHNHPLAVSIRLTNGLVLFQYSPEGATLENDTWMTKKYNIVRELEISSLLNTLKFQKNGQTLEDRGFDPKKYAWGGGGFPIRIKDTGLIGVAAASGLPHLEDHDILVEGISRFLKVPDVPRIPLSAKI